MPSQAPCPPIDELEQFLLGELEDEDSQVLESHLANCTQCQQQLTTITAEDEFVQTLRTLSKRHSAQESESRLVDPSEELVKLLAPHFKQIAKSLEETASFSSGHATCDTPTASGGATYPQISTDQTANPQRLGRYEIRGALGQGGMGTVLHAYDPLLKRSVAIKVIQSRILADQGIVGRFVREAQAAAAVEHDNIVAIYAVEMHEDAPCIVMPLLRGMTLKQRLEDHAGPLPLSEVLRVGREAAKGLAAAHAAGLIHCDIKPGNLWLEEPLGRVKVLDFGLAIVHDEAENNAEGISGTPGYLAPEQARGLSLDQRTDIFSLGCVLYRMATGVAPFTGERRLRALWTLLSDPPAAARELNSQLPPELSDLISRMLSREPSQRPATTTEVVEALEALERRLVEQKNRSVRRRWIAAMVVVVFLSGSTAAWWAMMNTPPVELPVKMTFAGDEPPVAIVLRHEGQEQTLTLGREKTLDLQPGDYTARLVVEQPGRALVPNHFTVEATKPRRLRVALVGEVAHHSSHTQPVTCVAAHDEPKTTIYSVGLDRSLVAWDPLSEAAPRFIYLPHAAHCLAVSPTGKELAVGGGNKQEPIELDIRIWNASDLTLRGDPLVAHSRLVNAVAYSPDGTQLVSAGADGVFLWNLSNGESQALNQAENQAILAIAFSADGKQLLTGSDEGQVNIWDLSTGVSAKNYTASDTAVRAVAFLDKRVVAAGDDGTIRIWNDGALQQEWLGNGKPILALAVSPDQTQVLSGDSSGKIRVWSVSRGQTIDVLSGSENAINSLAFIVNGRQAVSGDADGVVRLWQLPFSD